MRTFKIGYIVGSTSAHSINRKLAIAISRLAQPHFEFVEIPLCELPVYNRDHDADYPQPGNHLKAAIESVDAVLIVTPEYNRGIPGALKNALDFASRPWGTNSFAGKPVAIAGASGGPIGTAVAQFQLRGTLGFLDAIVMGQPEAYIQLTETSIDETTGEPSESLAGFLRGYVATFEAFVAKNAEKPDDEYQESSAA
ncbi:MAG: NADPH-dependent FMN reductase [Candidatus Nanopelagicales bacterium]